MLSNEAEVKKKIIPYVMKRIEGEISLCEVERGLLTDLLHSLS